MNSLLLGGGGLRQGLTKTRRVPSPSPHRLSQRCHTEGEAQGHGEEAPGAAAPFPGRRRDGSSGTAAVWSQGRPRTPPHAQTPTPAECTMHLGAPVVPDENMMNRGWLKGSCSNSSCGAGSPRPVARKSSRNTLWAKGRETDGAFRHAARSASPPAHAGDGLGSRGASHEEGGKPKPRATLTAGHPTQAVDCGCSDKDPSQLPGPCWRANCCGRLSGARAPTPWPVAGKRALANGG